jgi:branched-chain amino acid transport system substrate-binding protein
MDRQDADNVVLPDQPIARRSLLKGAGAGALAVGAGGFLAACGSGIKGTGSSSATGTIKIGFVTPLTGSLAGFASGDKFVLDQIKATSAYKNGIKVGG